MAGRVVVGAFVGTAAAAVWNPFHLNWPQQLGVPLFLIVYSITGGVAGATLGVIVETFAALMTVASTASHGPTPKRCTALRRDGKPCQGWAVESDPIGRCPGHRQRASRESVDELESRP